MTEKLIAEPQQSWQQQLAQAFSNIEQLCRFLQLDPEKLNISRTACNDFPLRVPLSFAENMQKGKANDPLLRQVLPIQDEMQKVEGFINDPVGDIAATQVPGLIHKYHGRVLLINTGSCAINCRYCFRRNFPYADNQLGIQKLESAIMAIKQDHSIQEVILSGGDPLVLSDEKLSSLFNHLKTIKHIKRIRIHTRLPVVLPDRINQAFLNTLYQSEQQIIMVIHSNHGNELSAKVINACQLIKQTGCTLFNQSVLLNGVNDNVEALCQLNEKLFAAGIIPYYLHLLDKAGGTAHFQVTETEALELMTQVQKKLPGYMVPKLVKEIAGGYAKQVVL